MHEKSQELLNRAVADELAAVHQYLDFHFHCDDQGYVLLATLVKQTRIQDMRHIEQLSERILFLGGDVAMKVSHEVQQIRDVRKMLETARKMEEDSAKDYNRAAIECTNNADSASRQIFEGLVSDEERHFDQFDNEITAMEKFGDNYLALQSIERSKNRAAGQERDSRRQADVRQRGSPNAAAAQIAYLREESPAPVHAKNGS